MQFLQYFPFCSATFSSSAGITNIAAALSELANELFLPLCPLESVLLGLKPAFLELLSGELEA